MCMHQPTQMPDKMPVVAVVTYLRLIPDVAHLLTVQIRTQVHSFKTERPMNFKLSLLCTVLHDVSEFLQNACALIRPSNARETTLGTHVRQLAYGTSPHNFEKTHFSLTFA